MSDPASTSLPDPPFALWTVFRGLPRWYFARGCPPTIALRRGGVRVLHLSVLLATMGCVATAIGAMAVGGLMRYGVRSPWHLAALGLAIGVLLLVPLSRWLERPWWLTALAVPASTVWFGMLDEWWQLFHRILPTGEWHIGLTWWLTTTVAGLGLAVWMVSPGQPRSWWLPLGAIISSTIATVSYLIAMEVERSGFPVISGQFFSFVMHVQPIALSIALTSATLGIRLWDARPRRQRNDETDWTAAEADLAAVWAIFRGFPRWYFARGLPPTLEHPVPTVRRVRAIVLLGTIGVATSWVSVLWLYLERILPLGMLFGSEGSLLFSPGVWFGLLVLVPLSRWVGRGWILSMLLVPISTAVYFGAVHLYVRHAFNPDQFLTEWLGPAVCGLWGGFGVSVWFIQRTKPRTWGLVPWVAFVGGVATWSLSLFSEGPASWLPWGLEELVEMNLLLGPFQTLVAMALGVRLWWPTPSESNQPSPRPAANTDATATVSRLCAFPPLRS